MIWRSIIGVSAGIVFSGGILAHPAVPGTRIKTIEFAENTMVAIEGCTNFQTTVVFGPDEKIENVGLGDANQWQVMPNKRADLLFVKPLVAHAFSNMTVVTGRRVYNFELRSAPEAACRRGKVVYILRFHYLDVPAKASAQAESADPESLLPPPEKRNSAYTYSGDTNLVPFRVFDDGKSTFFLWEKGVATPAIYVVGSDDKESLVNYSNHGEYVAVDLVGKAFVLRRGDQSAKLYNDAFVAPKLDAQSPQPAEKAQHSFWPF
ncbi:MAG: TrbG/VirB9 family P-type conjugative transfer protein [Rhizomicrobium sp.]